MIKKVKIAQLMPGMFIHDLNCGWMEHSFLSNSFKVKNEQTIKKILEYGISDLYIDTDKGLDVIDAPTAAEADRENESELYKAAEQQCSPNKNVSLQEELTRAREIKKEAKKTIQGIMEEVRLGREIKTEKVEKVVDKMVDSIFRNQNALICLGRIKKMDEYTYIHSMSVCVLLISFGRHLGFDAQQLREVGVGAMLHDIGKVKVPLEILNKTTPLTDEEFGIIRKHVEYSHSVLKETEGISGISIALASQHHERINGKGYHLGLAGDEISLHGQAAAIVDVYDAMTSRRCYQRRYEPTETLKKLYEWSNSYSKDLVQKFVRCVGIYPVGSLVRLESGLLGVVTDPGKENLLQPVVRAVYDTKKSRHVMPVRDLDLSIGCNDRILDYEVPDKWNIHPETYLS